MRRLVHKTIRIFLLVAVGCVAAVLLALARSAINSYSSHPDFRGPTSRQLDDAGFTAVGPDNLRWHWEAWSTLGVHYCSSLQTSASFGPRELRQHAGPWWSESADPPASAAVIPNWAVVEEVAFGWPLPCLSRQSVRDIMRGVTSRKYELEWQTRSTPTGPEPMVWPKRVLWRGIVIDGLVLAGIAWGTGAVIRRLRGQRRRLLNHCPACNYDLKGLSPTAACPECGKLPSRPPSAT